MKKMNGKKTLALMAAVVMAVSLMGCGSANTGSTGSQGQSSTVQNSSTQSGTGQGSSAEQGSGAVSGSVTASGSSALLPLAQAAADEFMTANPDCSVIVNGGGSGTGLKQVADGSVDIGNSDVFAEDKLDASTAAALKDHEVCTITMAAVVNKDLGISNLTTQQLTDIFTGKTTNWKAVGGPDEDIILVTRPASSGTRALFGKWALGGVEEASNASLETDDSGTLLQTVQDNKGAIGYVALSYLVNNDNLQAVSIDGVAPSLENTYSGTYKVWGYEHMYTKGDGSAPAQAFISFMQGDGFAQQMESLGYGVVSRMTDAAVKSHAE